MTDSELTERLRLLPACYARQGDSVFTHEQKRLIATAYSQLLGKTVRRCTCNNRYCDALTEILTHTKIKLTKMEKRKYMLFSGELIWIGNECYSNANITDEIAERYLELHPDAKERKFQRYPEEVKEEQPTEAAPAPAPAPKKKTTSKKK